MHGDEGLRSAASDRSRRSAGSSTLRRRGAVVVSALLLSVAACLASPAFAGPGDEAGRRLDDRRFFVESLGRAWEPLVADVRATLTDLPDAERAASRKVRDEVWEKYGTARLKSATEPGEQRAFELFAELSEDHSDEAKRPAFALKCSEIDVMWAERAEQAGKDAEALAFATDALRRTKNYEPALGIVARLAVKEARKAQEADDFIRALEILETAAAQLPPTSAAIGTVETERRTVLDTTGEVRIEWLGDWAVLGEVKGTVTDFRDASIAFQPAGAAKKPPLQIASKKIRVRNGRYQITATGKGPDTYSPPASVEVVSAGTSVVLLTALPAGMVLVPAVGAQDAFLIDRTEVPNSVFAQYGGRAGPGQADYAASGVDFADAQRFAVAAGKQLPTRDQWRTAAFGSPTAASPAYPWGDERPQGGTHYYSGEGPGPVNSCPAGASRFSKCLNMAGNVWEWLSDGWFIGASYKQAPRDDGAFGREFDTAEQGGPVWTANYLRDPAPSLAVWQNMPSATDRAKYSVYRVRDADTLAQIGLRCVVPLGKPSRK